MDRTLINKLKAGGIWHATYERDDKGIIKRLRLINKQGISVVLDKDVCKEAMKFGALKIDNVDLTKDGKLYALDSLIAKYYESCKLLGCEPLEIKLINGKYVVTGIPNTVKNFQIPPFVSGMHVSGLSRYAVVPTVTSNDNGGTSNGISTNEFNSGIDKVLKEIDIVKQQNTEISKNISKKEYDKQELNNLIQSISADNKEMLSMLNEIKKSTDANGRDIFEIKENLTNGLSDATEHYNEIIKRLATKVGSSKDKKKPVIKIPESAGFITDDRFSCLKSEESYLETLKKYDMQELVKFEHIGIVKNLLEYIYLQYIATERTFKSMDPSILDDLNYMQEFSTKWELKKNTFDGYIHHRSLMGIADDAMVGMAQAAGNTIDTVTTVLTLGAKAPETFAVKKAMGVVKLPFDLLDNLLNKHNVLSRQRQVNKLHKLTGADSEINDFFECIDRDIFEWLVEYNLGDKRGASLKMFTDNIIYQMKYRDLLRLLYVNAQHKTETTSHFDQDTIRMIALAYLGAHKIICGRTSTNEYGVEIDLGIDTNIGCDISELQIHYHDRDTNEQVLRCKDKYDSLILQLMFVNMLILGFEPQFAKTKIIKELDRVQKMVCNPKANITTATAELDKITIMREGYAF